MLSDELAQRNIGYETGIFEEGGWENISAGRQSMQKKRRKKKELEVIVYVLCVVECDVTDACKATLTKANHGGQQ